MQQLKFILNKIRMPQPTQSAIMVIGGAEDKVHGRLILQGFFHQAGDQEAKIAIIPSASREPIVIGDRYTNIFQEMGAKEIRVLDIRDRSQGEDAEFLSYIKDCSGVFLTGGDQLRLCGLLAETSLMEALRSRVRLGEVTLAGTSAGAAIMGHHMIAGGGSGESPNLALVDMAMGLGIIPEVIVDQHFHNRNRMARLMSAITTHPDLLGLGIDEDTCASVDRNGIMQVLGKATVTVVDPSNLSYTNQEGTEPTQPLSLHNLKVHILSHGDRYHIYKRHVLPSSPNLPG